MDNQTILKERVQSILKDSLLCINRQELFLDMAVVADSVKSLIGTNLDNPSLDMVDWLESK